MKGTKALKIIKSLNKEEFRRLNKFLRSPFFNYTKSAVLAYDLLRKHDPGFDSPKLEKDAAWKKIFPAEAFDEKKYWRFCNHFTKMLEKFLVVLQMEKEPREEKKVLIRSLGKRNIYDLFEKETRLYLQENEQMLYRDQDYFWERAQLNFDYFFHPLTTKLTLNDRALLELMDSVDKQFALTKLRIGSELKNRERILSKKYYIRFLDKVVDERQKDFLEENILFKLYKLLFRLYDEKADHHIFYELKEELNHSIHQLRFFDQSLFMTQMINYAIWQINIGNTAFAKEALSLYQLSLKIELTLENGKIKEAVFGNIVTLGCSANEFAWTENFINNYSVNLNQNIREDTVAYSQGVLHYFKKDYEASIQLLTQYNFSPFHQVKVRLLIVRSIFELFIISHDYYDLLSSHLEAFGKFLRRDDLQESIKKGAFLNFLKYIKKIAVLLIERKKKKDFLIVYDKISNENALALKNWLLQKAKSFS